MLARRGEMSDDGALYELDELIREDDAARNRGAFDEALETYKKALMISTEDAELDLPPAPPGHRERAAIANGDRAKGIEVPERGPEGDALAAPRRARDVSAVEAERKRRPVGGVEDRSRGAHRTKGPRRD